MTEPADLGKSVERYALQHLREAGLSTLAQNWSCRFGEIDLIMLEQDTVVFVEVRYRKNNYFGGALDSIDQLKRDKLIKTTEYFFNENPQWLEHPCRFDVITAHPSHAQTFTLDWIQDAFES
ncbi:YraN family protein [Pseudomonas sp. C27(2019)]|uniref:YraN family protein n=1 Tax=Pseudomonas sp. C27(2019) TaxID=2604941 RepID=UPI0021145E65|nr:YraN family protein [Pseudomonas sp. C27(2019)]